MPAPRGRRSVTESVPHKLDGRARTFLSIKRPQEVRSSKLAGILLLDLPKKSLTVTIAI